MPGKVSPVWFRGISGAMVSTVGELQAPSHAVTRARKSDGTAARDRQVGDPNGPQEDTDVTDQGPRRVVDG